MATLSRPVPAQPIRPASDPRTRNDRRTFVSIMTALAGGVAVGLFFGETVAPLHFIGDGFVKLLQVTVLPYVLGSMLFGLGSRSLTEAKHLALRGGVVLVVVWACGLTLVTVLSLAYPARSAGDRFFAEAPPPAPIDWLTLYIPSNPFHSLANNLMPAVVLFGLLAGSALCAVDAPRKQTLLEALEAFNEAMGRIARVTLMATPIGLFAIAATTAGTIQPGQLLRLQLWFVIYIGGACIVSFWMLPWLVGLVTPVSASEFATRLRSPLLTAFAVGDVFIVLPIIAEDCKLLLRKHGVPQGDSDSTIGVIVPLLFNFPHSGKILSLGFVPFAAWFNGGDLSLGGWLTLGFAGVLTVFGSLNAAIPFLLDLFALPADLFELFTMSSVLNSRFGALVAATHIAAVGLVIAAVLLRRAGFHGARLLRFGLGTAAIVVTFVLGTRLVFGQLVPDAPQGLTALSGFHLRPPLAPVTHVDRPRPPSQPPIRGRRLAEIGERAVLRVGYFADSTPYAFRRAGGEVIGFDIEMAHTLATDLNVSVELLEIERQQAADALGSGTCDIIMSGFIASLDRAQRMATSHTYAEERLGFLVRDEHRGRFLDLAALDRESPRIGLPAIDGLAPLIQQRLPSATFIGYPSTSALVAAIGGAVDAAVLPIDRAFYLSRVDPRLTAVLPTDPTSSVLLVYALPAGELEFRNAVDAWIDIKRAQGAFDRAHAYWVRGEGLVPREPRWSVARNVLGWDW